MEQTILSIKFCFPTSLLGCSQSLSPSLCWQEYLRSFESLIALPFLEQGTVLGWRPSWAPGSDPYSLPCTGWLGSPSQSRARQTQVPSLDLTDPGSTWGLAPWWLFPQVVLPIDCRGASPPTGTSSTSPGRHRGHAHSVRGRARRQRPGGVAAVGSLRFGENMVM